MSEPLTGQYTESTNNLEWEECESCGGTGKSEPITWPLTSRCGNCAGHGRILVVTVKHIQRPIS